MCVCVCKSMFFHLVDPRLAPERFDHAGDCHATRGYLGTCLYHGRSGRGQGRWVRHPVVLRPRFVTLGAGSWSKSWKRERCTFRRGRPLYEYQELEKTTVRCITYLPFPSFKAHASARRDFRTWANRGTLSGRYPNTHVLLTLYASTYPNEGTAASMSSSTRLTAPVSAIVPTLPQWVGPPRTIVQV